MKNNVQVQPDKFSPFAVTQQLSRCGLKVVCVFLAWWILLQS